MMSFTIPQPQGRFTEENNQKVREWEGHPWHLMINHTHTRLTSLDPDYEILQIKDKFGGLRFYVNMSEGYLQKEGSSDRVQWIIEVAEAWVAGYEYGIHNPVGSSN